jgi:hypothetical protein
MGALVVAAAEIMQTRELETLQTHPHHKEMMEEVRLLVVPVAVAVLVLLVEMALLHLEVTEVLEPHLQFLVLQQLMPEAVVVEVKVMELQPPVSLE